jgi:hypothetical protein
MKTKTFITALLISISTVFITTSCEDLWNLLNSGLTEQEVIDGLKQALEVGTDNSVVKAHATDGYFLHSVIKIPFPPEADVAKDILINTLGQGELVDEFILELNRAAEDAAVKAKPIFFDAITSITIDDAWGILKGADNAATAYLHDKTYLSLVGAFAPDITTSLEKVGAAQTWATLVGYYNQFANYHPTYNPINPDLGAYATGKALDGLFFLVEEEEYKIRTDPAARITDLLARVFAEQD